MPIDSVAAFVDAVRQHRLLEPEQLDVVVREQSRTTDPRVLAKALIQKGWLTPYQVNQVLQSKGADLVLGQYRILERVGEGGMGQVFKARHAAMGRVVALKVIRKERLANNDAVKRFHREIQAAAKLTHPNIVISFDADAAGSTHYLAMEFVDGIDLAQLTRKEGPLPVDRACEYIRQAAMGLQYAHERGMVHRDIKPANLLLERPAETNGKATEGTPSTARQPRGGKSLVKVLDMGLARLQPHEQQDESGTALSVDGSVMGTPDFMAPEQAKNSHLVDHRADQYSLGCTFFYLLTRQPLFQASSNLEKLLKHQMDPPPPLTDFRQDVPEDVQHILNHMLAKRPEERFASCGDVAAALAPFCTPGATPPPRSGSGYRPSLPSTGMPVALAGTALLTAPTAAAVAAPLGLAPALPHAARSLRHRSVLQKPAVIAGLALFLLVGAIGLVLAVVSSSRTDPTGAAAAATPKETPPRQTEPAKPTESGRATESGKPPPPPSPLFEFPLHRLVPENAAGAVLLNVGEVLRSPHVSKIVARFQLPPGVTVNTASFVFSLEFGVSLDQVHRILITTPGSPQEADYFLLMGQLDGERIRNKFREKKALTHSVESRKGEQIYYELQNDKGEPKYFAAFLRNGTLAIATKDKPLLNVIERSSHRGGPDFMKKGTSDLKDRELQRMLDRPDGKMQIQAFFGGNYKGKPEEKTIDETSALSGIKSSWAGIALSDGVDARLTVNCTTFENAKAFKDAFTNQMREAAKKDKGFEPIARAFLDATYLLSKDEKATVIIERHFSRDEVDQLIDRVLPPPKR